MSLNNSETVSIERHASTNHLNLEQLGQHLPSGFVLMGKSPRRYFSHHNGIKMNEGRWQCRLLVRQKDEELAGIRRVAVPVAGQTEKDEELAGLRRVAVPVAGQTEKDEELAGLRRVLGLARLATLLVTRMTVSSIPTDVEANLQRRRAAVRITSGNG